MLFINARNALLQMKQIETSDFMVPTIFITPKFSSTFSPSFLHNLG